MGERTYRILNMRWRSSDLKSLVRLCDPLHMRTRYNDAGEPLPGNFPHFRMPSIKESTTCSAPRGLPVNYYNPSYLEELDDEELEELGAVAAVPIVISEATLAVANRYKECTGKSSRPKPAVR